jgi:hypothetical protein
MGVMIARLLGVDRDIQLLTPEANARLMKSLYSARRGKNAFALDSTD